MKIEQKTEVYYRPDFNDWAIQNQISVKGVGDFTFRILLDYMPNVERVMEEKNKTMQEVYIGYMLKGE